jgi:hypothetical protein
LKKIHYKKRVGGVAQGVGPEFKPQYRKKKKKVIEVMFNEEAMIIFFSVFLMVTGF